MTFTEQLIAQAKIAEDTDISTRARMSTNEAGRKAYQVGDYLASLVNDFNDTDNNETIEQKKKDAAFNEIFSTGDSEMHQQMIYDAKNDEYINMTPSKLSANDLAYTAETLKKDATENDQTLYNIHYGTHNKQKIGRTSYDDVKMRHPRIAAKGGIIEADKVKDVGYLEHQMKNYALDNDLNAFQPSAGDRSRTSKENLSTVDRQGDGVDFNNLGLAGGQSEVLDTKKILQTLPDIAGAIDTAKSPEEKAILKDRFNKLQERTLKNRYENNQMSFLKTKREEFEKKDEENGGQLSPSGFGDFKETLIKDPKLMKAYEDQYRREESLLGMDGVSEMDKKSPEFKALILQEYMAEKSNQLQEAGEDMFLSKNESAINSDLLAIYRASDLTAGQATAAIANSIFDPANLAPGALAGKAAKLGSKAIDAVANMFGRGPVSKKAKQVIGASVAGAGYTAAEDTMRQQTDVNAQKKDEIDLGQTATAAAIGGVVGGGLVKTIQTASSGVQKLLQEKGITEETPAKYAIRILTEEKEKKDIPEEARTELDNIINDISTSQEQLPETKLENIEDVAEVETASIVKPEAAKKEKEKKEDENKIVLNDSTTKEQIELDLGSTTQKTKARIIDLREEDRLPFAKEFIRGKQRIQRVGDDTDYEGDIPLNSGVQVHVNGRGVISSAVDKANRTVDQAVEIKDTPEASVNNVMKGYKLSEKQFALDPDKRILQHVKEMEHHILAIEGMKDYYKENNIEADFSKLDELKTKLTAKIEERSKAINDKQLEFDSKAEFAKENLPSQDRERELKLIEDVLVKDTEIKDIKGLMNVIRKATDFVLGQSALQRIKSDNIDKILPEDIAKRTPVIEEIKRIINSTNTKGQPLSSKEIRDKLRANIPGVIKKILSNANDDASKIVAIKTIKEFDEAAGFNRKEGSITTKPEAKTIEPKEKSGKKVTQKDAERERVIESWKNHKPGLERQKLQKALGTNKYEDNDSLLEGVKGEIYAMLKNEKLSSQDRAELTEALVHADKHDFTKDPLELSKEKKEKYINRKNSEESQKIFNQDLVTKDVTQIKSVRELFDAASQVAQIVGAFFGDLNMFRAIGATTDSAGKDYRVIIGEQLQKEGIIAKDIEKVKDIVKVPTRNVTYLEGRSSAIKGMMEELNIDYDKAARTYDGIMRELEKGDAAGLLKFANKIAEEVENGNIPAQFTLKLPDGRKIKVDARQEEDVIFRLFGTEWKSKKKTNVAKPGTIAATIVQSLDSFVKDKIIKEMPGYDGITVHDGFAFKTEVERVQATQIYLDALKQINESNYLNQTLHDISGKKIPLEPNEKIDWSQVVADKLFSPEFEIGAVPVHEIRTNMSLNSDRLMKPTEILSSLLNAADPTGKTGFSGMRASVIRYLSKSDANKYNSKTNLSEMDEFVSKVLFADTLEGMQKWSNNWKKEWMKKNKVKPSREVDDAFEKLTNIIRATAESIPEYSGKQLMEKEQVMNQYARIYFKNLAAKNEAGIERANSSLEKNIEKDTTIEKIIEDAAPEDLPEIVNTIREVVETENGKDIPSRDSERRAIEADGQPMEDKIETDGVIKKTFDEAYLMIRKALSYKKIREGDISHATHNAVKLIKKIFKKSKIDKKQFKKIILDSGYRHIRGMTREQADRFVQIHKSTAEMYGKYIDAKARAHTNPGNRYGYFRNNMLELVMEKEQLSPEKAAVRANAILKLSAIKNMTDEHWNYVEKPEIKNATKEFMDIIDVWDGIAKESVFVTGKKNFNDSYLATVRSSGLKDLEEEAESKLLEFNTLGKLIDDEATLKSLNETTNLEEYMETNKIRKVGQKFYRILVDEDAEKAFMNADPVDILSKTVFTTMAKVVGSDSTKHTREIIKDTTIFPEEKTKDSRLLTAEDKEFLAKRARVDVKDIKANYVDIVLGRQILPTVTYTPLGKKTHSILNKLTQDLKYNLVPINPNSIINGAFWTIASVVGRHPIKGIPALLKATAELKKYKEIDNRLKAALAKGDMKTFTEVMDERSKTSMFQAISEGMTVNSLDGVTQAHSIASGAVKKVLGEDTKMLKVVRTAFLRPDTPVAEQLIDLFSASDSVGRMASYLILKGSKYDTGVGAGIKANATFGDMDHVSHPLVETLNGIPVTAFTKWGERTFTEILKLPRAQQATLIASGLLMTNVAEEYDIDDKGFNPLRAFVEMPDDFVVAPVSDNIDKYSGDTSAFEHTMRATTQFILPSTYNRLLLTYIFDERNGSVQKKAIKLIFPPRGVDYTNKANGTRVRASGNKGSLMDTDLRPWWEQMMVEDSRKTQEQYDAGSWRHDIEEILYGKDQIEQWKKENKLDKLRKQGLSSPAYSSWL